MFAIPHNHNIVQVINSCEEPGKVNQLSQSLQFLLSLILLGVCFAVMPDNCKAEDRLEPSQLTRFGEMHEVVGKRQHHGRVALAEIASKPHFYGVGALEGLNGEITLLDSEVLITTVDDHSHPQTEVNPDAKAALLVGQSVVQWNHLNLNEDVSSDRFDEIIQGRAKSSGIDISKPFVFVVEGKFRDVRLHVINGACPVHARIKKLELDPKLKPFELEVETISGTLVGIYAPDSVGKLTHPGTSVHAHLIYRDSETGKRITGHLEKVGLGQGAKLKFPKR